MRDICGGPAGGPALQQHRMPLLLSQFSLHRPLRAQRWMIHLLAVKIAKQLVCFCCNSVTHCPALWRTFHKLLMLCELSSSHQATLLVSMQQQQQDLHCDQKCSQCNHCTARKCQFGKCLSCMMLRMAYNMGPVCRHSRASSAINSKFRTGCC